ncbi:MAG: ABC transporter substrate-binding protein [archaeon]
MKSKIFVISLVIVVALLFGCTASTQQKELKIGFITTPESALVQVAQDKAFFEQQDLNVSLEKFTAGKLALQAFLAGNLDMAVVGEVPVALARMQGNNFYVLAQIATCPGENPVLVHGKNIVDVKTYFASAKRKLATSIGGTPEFYTYNFLNYYGIDANQVEIVAQSPSDMPAAFVSGSVDAISVFEPYPTIAENQLNGETTRLEIPREMYSPKYILVANKKWVDNNPQEAESLIKALIQAQKYVAANPTESKQIVAKMSGFDPKLIQSVWGKCLMQVELNDSLLQTWAAESVWAIETKKVDKNAVTDFESMLRKDLLSAANAS